MSQTRFHLTAGKAAAQAIADEVEQIFELEGFPIAVVELDEARDLHEVSLYVDGDGAIVADRLSAMGHDWEREVLPDIDWVTKSLEGLKPVRSGRFLVHGGHDRHHVRIGDVGILIEAGLAFGTGHHGTTAGCLDMIRSVARRERPRNALDLGTGSAVLAIAIARTEHIPVLATDIDPVATKVAKENARLNHVAGQVRAVTATGFGHPSFRTEGPFDLIVANILARPLMRLAPEMARHVAPGGSIVLSGILDRQRNAVVAAYVGQRFRHVTTTHREGWVTIHLKR